MIMIMIKCKLKHKIKYNLKTKINKSKLNNLINLFKSKFYKMKMINWMKLKNKTIISLIEH